MPCDHAPLPAASAATPFPRSGSAPSAAARPSLDAPPGYPYVAPVLPLFARPIWLGHLLNQEEIEKKLDLQGIELPDLYLPGKAV